MTLRERFCGAPTFDAFVAAVDANRDLKADRYRDIRRWYVNDGGIAVLNEIVAVIEGSSSRNIAA